MTDRTRAVLSWCVHLYTGLGLPIAFLGLLAAVNADARAAFWWMFAAFFIDCTDGTLARAVDVRRGAPDFDGRKLDDITDYLNYVFVPLYLAWRLELVGETGLPALLLALLASGYGFCSERAKTDDGYFTGFPSYWNVAVLYAYLLGLPRWTNALVFALLALAVFAPLKCLYPSKTPHFQKLNVVLTCVWFFAIFVVLLQLDHPPRGLVTASLAYVAYYFGMSFWLQFGAASSPEATPA
ncbi:MAG: CDP-diacylglycerol O-phosphatidyltransferase [Candidatus Wallbacteria bacterium]|nr:CDP-diacylglycerol O-phosphatidyltransferase [Candidatus Wallbacteria bacterium]